MAINATASGDKPVTGSTFSRFEASRKPGGVHLVGLRPCRRGCNQRGPFLGKRPPCSITGARAFADKALGLIVPT